MNMGKIAPNKEKIAIWEPKGEYAWLTNVWPCRIDIEGRTYASVENYYQSQKAADAKDRDYISDAPSGEEAKKRAYEIRARWRDDWGEPVMLEVMKKGMFAKFAQHPELAEKLLATGDREIHEEPPAGVVGNPLWAESGKDMLWHLFEELRDALRSGKPELFLSTRG